MKVWKNQNGFLSVEAAMVMPLLLTVVIMFIIFFYLNFKIGAFSGLTNHQELMWRIKEGQFYKVEMLADSYAKVMRGEIDRRSFDEGTQISETIRVDMTSPVVQHRSKLQRKITLTQIPFLYQVAFSKRLGEKLNKIRPDKNE